MMNSLSPKKRPNSLLFRRQSASRWLLAGVLASAGLLSGAVPGWQAGRLERSTVALAQSNKAVTAEKVANFVRAAMAMEPKRKQAVQEIQAVMGAVPAIRCDNRDSFNELKPVVRGVAINYCNESKRIVESSGLSVEDFNEILMIQKTDQTLRDRIQGEICRVDSNLCRKQ